MNKVFLFWIGDQERIKPLLKEFDRQGVKYEVGPSKADDEYLSKEYKYYADSKKYKIYSFMSDVWRAYKMANNKGIYVDASVKIGPKFHELFKHIEKHDAWFPRCRWNEIAWNLMGSNGKCDFFQEVLDNFKNYGGSHPQLFYIGPHVADYVAQKRGYLVKRNDNIFVSNNIMFDTAKPAFDELYVRKYGDESWKTQKSKQTRNIKSTKSYAQQCAEGWGTLSTARRYNTKINLPMYDIERVNLCTRSLDINLNKVARSAHINLLIKYKIIKFHNYKIWHVIARTFKKIFKNNQAK